MNARPHSPTFPMMLVVNKQIAISASRFASQFFTNCSIANHCCLAMHGFEIESANGEWPTLRNAS